MNNQTNQAEAIRKPTNSGQAAGGCQQSESGRPSLNKRELRTSARARYDEEAKDLFARFQAARWELSDRFVRCRFLRPSHFNFPERVRTLGSLVFDQMAEDFTASLLGEVNSFLLNVHQADSWIRTIRSSEESKRSGLLLEFAEPLLEISVGRPYSLRNQFIFAGVHLVHQANSQVQKDWKDELPNDNQIDYKVLLKIGGGFRTFPGFLDALKKLNDDEFKASTRNFRHLHQHRFRLQFEEGLTPYFDRKQTAAGASYAYRIFRPLQVNNLVARLYKQHERALAVFLSYWRLVNELSCVWPTTQAGEQFSKE